MNYDVIIIGAGAAGLMASGLIGQGGLKVALLEKNKQVGKKIFISGGGRCNFTNKKVSSSDYYSLNPHFPKSSLARYTPDDFIALVDHYEVDFYEKKLGQLFCRRSAQEIITLLLNELRKGDVQLYLNQDVQDIEYDGTLFQVIEKETSYSAPKVVIATGGLSLPSLGASDFGYRMAKKFGLRCTELRPALVPLVLEEPFSDLSGVSLPVCVKLAKYSIEDDLLFTHKGLSGPATLKASLYWDPGVELEIDFLPQLDFEEELFSLKKKKGKRSIVNILKELLPDRLVSVMVEKYRLPSGFIGELSDKDLKTISDHFKKFKITPKETEGYRKAEVTRGGVHTDELSSKNLCAKNIEGLYFIGEVVDVTGLLGGYNFQWAWASAHAVAQAIIQQD